MGGDCVCMYVVSTRRVFFFSDNSLGPYPLVYFGINTLDTVFLGPCPQEYLFRLYTFPSFSLCCLSSALTQWTRQFIRESRGRLIPDTSRILGFLFRKVTQLGTKW